MAWTLDNEVKREVGRHRLNLITCSSTNGAANELLLSSGLLVVVALPEAEVTISGWFRLIEHFRSLKGKAAIEKASCSCHNNGIGSRLRCD